MRMDDRVEFRGVLREVIRCLRSQLEVPGVTPFDAEDLRAWFRDITAEDIRAVWDEQHRDGNDRR
jgi:hypothetical protein